MKQKRLNKDKTVKKVMNLGYSASNQFRYQWLNAEVDKTSSNVKQNINDYSGENIIKTSMCEDIVRPLDISMNKSIYSSKDNYDKMKGEIKQLRENKVLLEATVEIAVKKNEVYEKEIKVLRDNLSELRLNFSKINEEAMKLEISRLSTSYICKEKDIQALKTENENLKAAIQKYQHDYETMLAENRKYREETKRKFNDYRVIIERLSFKNKTALQNANEIEQTTKLSKEKGLVKTDCGGVSIEYPPSSKMDISQEAEKPSLAIFNDSEED
jgi:hypothetical protein